jgi:predicted Kef-type K+ transport protein
MEGIMKSLIQKILVIAIISIPGAVFVIGVMGLVGVIRVSPDFAHVVFVVIGIMSSIISTVFCYEMGHFGGVK